MHEAQQQLATVNDALDKINKRVYRRYFITLEVMIARYQYQMRMLLRSYVPKFIELHGDREHTKRIASDLGKSLQAIADPTLIAAANVGFHRCLSDLQLHGIVDKFATPVVAPHYLSQKSIADNHMYIKTSLVPYIANRLAKTTIDTVPQAVSAIESRIAQYGHWVWRTSEFAYIAGMKDFSKFRKERKS